MEPFWASIPVYTGMGNHESNYVVLQNGAGKLIKTASFPYATQSGEAAFAKSYVNPTNGPDSEDGASYDPDPTKTDFPTYKENVYSYTYANVGMIVLNTEYWKGSPLFGGSSVEGYVMDQQLAWLQQTLAAMEKNPKVDHVFIALHSSVFPITKSHSPAGMWYSGKNEARPTVAGAKVGKGILDLRDEILDLAINRSKKVVGFLTGSEHNFSALKVTPDTPIYPENYQSRKLKLTRSFYDINNGGGGSYAYIPTDIAPWSKLVEHFTAPTALSLFHVDGAHVSMEVVNPETQEKIADIKLR